MRCAVIGIDGIERAQLEHLAAAGVMPFLSELLRNGTLLPLRAPVPELSSTSWATFLTGVNPGRHGIYGFVDLQPYSYRTYFPNLSDMACPALWDFAGEAGLRTLCLNVPSTYPAKPMQGVMISGFVAPDERRAFYPTALRGELDARGYQLDVEVGDGARNPRAFLHRVHQSLESRWRAFEWLLKRESWELAMAVFTETDRVQHLLWDQLINPSSPLHEEVLEVYRHLDRALQSLVGSMSPDTRLFLVSDHGFTAVRCSVYVNAWLRQAGYLALPETAESLELIDGKTKAFALDPARIYLNRRSRYPRGRLDEQSAQEVRELLRKDLLEWRHPEDGEPILAEVLMGEEVYAGECSGQAPDLVLVPRPGFFLRGSHRHGPIFGHDEFTGMHTRNNGIFFAGGWPLTSSSVDMQDVAPTVLAALGLRWREGLDGRSILGDARE